MFIVPKIADTGSTIVEIVDSIDEDLVIDFDKLFVDTSIASADIHEIFANESINTWQIEDASERVKSIEFVDQVISKLPVKENYRLAVMGAGALINVVSFIASTLKENGARVQLFIFPSNSMSICDVAFGSLGLINSGKKKNAIRRMIDPEQIIISKEIFFSSPVEVRTDGLIEVAKHALFQNCPLFMPSFRGFLELDNDISCQFSLALEGLKMKSEVIELKNKKDLQIRAVFNYGHAFAHFLEEHSDYQYSHTNAVFMGILLDLELAGFSNLVDRIVELAVQSPKYSALVNLASFMKVNSVNAFESFAAKYREEECYISITPLDYRKDYIFDKSHVPFEGMKKNKLEVNESLKKIQVRF